MATSVVTVCDVPVRKQPCGKPARHKIDVTIGNKRYHGDACDEHLENVDKAFASVGIEITVGRVDSKNRKAMRTKSGKPFTTQDAREWLLEQNLITNPTGRISKANLDLYAEAH